MHHRYVEKDMNEFSSGREFGGKQWIQHRKVWMG